MFLCFRKCLIECFSENYSILRIESLLLLNKFVKKLTNLLTYEKKTNYFDELYRMCFVLYMGYAQGKTVSGKVTDHSNLPIPGVNVVVKSTKKGVTTDMDGKYSLSVSPGETLVFSFLGYKTIEQK